jgi:hypothetical protein
MDLNYIKGANYGQVNLTIGTTETRNGENVRFVLIMALDAARFERTCRARVLSLNAR